jgi:hypothetical protein
MNLLARDYLPSRKSISGNARSKYAARGMEIHAAGKKEAGIMHSILREIVGA